LQNTGDDPEMTLLGPPNIGQGAWRAKSEFMTKENVKYLQLARWKLEARELQHKTHKHRWRSA
jgi:hypothetical protein